MPILCLAHHDRQVVQGYGTPVNGSGIPYMYKRISGLYYKPITIVNDDSTIVNKLKTSLIDNSRVVIYNLHMFIVHVTTSTSLSKQPAHKLNNQAKSKKEFHPI